MTESLGNSIRNAKVTVEDLKTALIAFDDMEPEDRKDFTGRIFALLRAFGRLGKPGSGKPFTDEDRQEINKITAVQIRIEALSGVINDPKLKAWSMEVANDKDYILLREDVLIAAAETPLQEKDSRSYFEPEEFFRKLLEVSEEAGKG